MMAHHLAQHVSQHVLRHINHLTVASKAVPYGKFTAGFNLSREFAVILKDKVKPDLSLKGITVAQRFTTLLFTVLRARNET